MSTSFYPYVRSEIDGAVVWLWPEQARCRMEREIVPPMDTPEHDAWFDGSLETRNPDYDARLDVNMTEQNATFVLNELGFLSGTLHESMPVPLDLFEAGLRATIGRNPLPIYGAEGSDTRGARGARVISFGIRDGYANEQFARLLSLVEAAREYGASHIGWG